MEQAARVALIYNTLTDNKGCITHIRKTVFSLPVIIVQTVATTTV